jgi:hypothetical protein
VVSRLGSVAKVSPSSLESWRKYPSLSRDQARVRGADVLPILFPGHVAQIIGNG